MEFLKIFSFLIVGIGLPIAGIVAIVYLTLLLRQTSITVKNVDRLANNIEEKLELLEGPINTVVNIHENYIKMLGSLGAVLATLSNFSKKKKNNKGE